MKLSELLADTGRLTNRLPVPVLMSTPAAQRIVDAQRDVDTAQRAVERAERDVRLAEADEQEVFHRPRTAAAKADLEAAHAKLSEAEAELEQARVDAEPHLVDFVVESVGSDQWEALVTAHPPTEEQKERLKDQAGRVPEFNPQTFPLAAVAACLVEPQVDSLDDVKKLKAAVPDIVWHQIFAAVLRVNRGLNRVDPSWLGSERTRSSGVGSEQQSS